MQASGLNRIKDKAKQQLCRSQARYINIKARLDQKDYLFLRWVASMTAVEVYAIWERYAEKRLAIALTYHPQKLIVENNIKGLRAVSIGLATMLVRGGNRYFDFRSTSDLIEKSDRLVGKPNNPFRNISKQVRDYLDTLGGIRNYIVHQSDSGLASYKSYLSKVYDVKAKPGPEEFLNAIDSRVNSPAKREPRIVGLIKSVEQAIDLS